MQNRRDVSSRNSTFAQQMASWLASKHVSPNTISIFSMVFAAISLLSFYLDSKMLMIHWLSMILAIVGIQGRLVMNLLDGMVAIEYNKKSAVGGLYNEVPDRISDTLILLGTGFLASTSNYGMDLAYLAIILAAFTAYIRTLGASLNCPHYFSGPMAKQHRMALITLCCLVGIWYVPIFYWMLIVMNLGLLITCYRRLAKIAQFLKGNKPT
jgi:phosphatidylglycerophosphate synthase